MKEETEGRRRQAQSDKRVVRHSEQDNRVALTAAEEKSMDDFYVFGGIFGAVFTLIFIVTFVLIITRLVQGVGTWHKNNQSPKQTVSAVLVGKRTAVWGHSGTNTVGSTNTAYFLTFQTESGERTEFNVDGRVYGMSAEGDRGQLSFQGTRFLGFARQQDKYSGGAT